MVREGKRGKKPFAGFFSVNEVEPSGHYLAAAAGFFTDSGSVFGILTVNSVP
jgi:hypothetical protein